MFNHHFPNHHHCFPWEPPSEPLSILGRESEMTRATTLEELDEVAANAL